VNYIEACIDNLIDSNGLAFRLFPLYGNAICEKTAERERELQGLGGNDVTCYLIILKGRVRGKGGRSQSAYLCF